MLHELAEDGPGLRLLEADDLDVGLEPFGLRVMIDAVAERFAWPAREKGIALEVKTTPSVPAEAVGDVVRLRAVLFSLLDNAIRFTERGEVVASISADPTPGARMLLHAEVSDTGVGIAPQTLEQLFDAPGLPWRGSAVGPVADGGLAAACRSVELMDGQLGCSSVVGLGTTVWFTVPLDLPAA
jgi:signal transduction histidine kinase